MNFIDSKISIPYRIVNQFSRIEIIPSEINSNLENNIMLKLKELEGKCNNIGYIANIQDITEIGEGQILPENFTGSLIYKINFNCKMYIPTNDTIILSKIEFITSELIIAAIGPIKIFISKQNISQKWDSEFYNKENDRKLKKEDIVKTFIVNTRINKNDSQIKTIGKLIDYPTKAEIDKYYQMELKKDPESNYII